MSTSTAIAAAMDSLYYSLDTTAAYPVASVTFVPAFVPPAPPWWSGPLPLVLAAVALVSLVTAWQRWAQVEEA